MARRRREAPPAGMERVRSGIERWREDREKRSAMPEELWDAAVELARAHGVYGTAKALTIGYGALKKRAERRPSPGQRRDGADCARGFVELEGSQLARPAGTVIELWRADGMKLAIRLPAGERLDVAGLAAVFSSRGG